MFLAFSFLLSIFVVCLLRVQVEADQHYYIQLAQIFGFISVGFLYVTLIMSPIQKVIGSSELMKNIIFTRRATGVSVAYFAILHAGVALFAELGGVDGLFLLPDKFVWPLIFSTVALVLLCLLAITSLDKMVIMLGYPRWKWLQRFAYVCGVLIIIHVWAIGVHFTPGIISNICFAALFVLFGLECWRIADFLGTRYNWRTFVKYPFFLALWFAWVMLLGLVALSRPAAAHTMLKDSIAGAGAILHVNPDDDPVAGEKTSFLFDIQNANLTEQSTATLMIMDDQQRETNVPARVQGDAVAADYIFPQQGLYTLMLSTQQGGQQTHEFMDSLRVSRGVINGATVRDSPLWAWAGLLGTVIAATVVATAAFMRRKTIGMQSKL